MACCVITALVMNRLIKACDAFDFSFFQIKYNDEGEACAPAESEGETRSETCRLSIEGMTCGACVSSITQELESLQGVFRAGASLPLGRASVSYDPAAIVPEAMVKAVQALGYEAMLGARSNDETVQRLRQSQELEDLQTSISSSSVCATAIVALGYASSLPLRAFSYPLLRQLYAFLLVSLAFRAQIWDARSIHLRAWVGNSKSTATMDTLLSLSLTLSLLLLMLHIAVHDTGVDYASSGSFLTVVVLAGRYLEAVLRKEGNSSLATLYELQMENEIYRFSTRDVSQR